MNQNGGIHKGGFAVLCHRNGGSESPGILIYSIHEGIIIVMLAMLNKGNIHFGKYSSLIFMILLETVLIVAIGFGLNLIIRKLPAIMNIMFTGGRNEYHSKEKKQY